MSRTVGVVVVNFNGGDLTLDCLRSLVATDWPAESLRIVLVDNASSDDVVARVRAQLPSVEVIESPVNGGFGAGCNLGIRALADVEFVALVNNDATVDVGWLHPLVHALAADPELGAACPKILFAGQFRELELEAGVIRRRGDARTLGVLVSGVEVDGHDVWRRTQLLDGFWGIEPDTVDAPAQWTAGLAHLRVPVREEHDGSRARLRLSTDRPGQVILRSGEHTAHHEVDAHPAWYDVTLGGPAIDVVNNAGTVLTDEGFGADRGYQEPDDGRYDAPIDVFAWCGGAVLLRRTYLDDIGLFDESLFLYYEDLELAWRGTKHGWRSRYVPDSVVRHVHAATSVEGSALKRYYDERNHLLVLARHAPSGRAFRAAARSLLVTGSYTRRDVVAPALARRPVHFDVVKDRLTAFGGFVKLLPGAISARRSDRR